MELCDTDYKIILSYADGTANNWDDSNGLDDVFGTSVFPGSDTDRNDFGIVVIEDADSSCSESNPVINRGDKVMLTISARYAFNSSGTYGIPERTNMWGTVVPEAGSPGVISFTTPSTYADNIFDMQ
jgi:flagellin FlaB